MTYLRKFAFGCAAWAAIVSCALPAAARADDVLAARLGDLLGQERQSLEIVPAARLAALTAAPAPPAAPAAAAAGEVPAALLGEDAADPAVLSGDPLAGLVAAAPAAGDAEWQCLTEALYFEARGESLRGIAAVAEVILNRVDSPDYPRTICGVVHQGTGAIYRCQFSYTCDGRSDAITDPAAWRRVGQVARAMMDGAPRTLTGGATHYHNLGVSPSWAARFPRTAEIGHHRFYREPTRVASN
jgi:hypothetical protein